MKYTDVTLGVSSRGDMRALLICLSSVLAGSRVPRAIQVRIDGSPCNLSDFYLQQVADLARLRNVSFLLEVAKSEGTRKARDWQLDKCSTDYLWMLDDDVVVHGRCLEAYKVAWSGTRFAAFEGQDSKIAYLAGSKPDVSNTRNYPLFSFDQQGPEAVVEGANHNLIYDIETCWGRCAICDGLDSGNVLFFMRHLRDSGCRFTLFPDSTNASGDGTTFALSLHAKGLRGLFTPSAVAFHLEKPPGRSFGELAARTEMLLRVCDLKGLDKTVLKRYFLPGTWH